MKDNKGKSLDHLLLSKDDFEYRTGYDDSPEAVEETQRSAIEHFGEDIPNNVSLTSKVIGRYLMKQSTYDRVRGLPPGKNQGIILERYFANPEIIESLITKFVNIKGREFVILLLALRDESILQIPRWNKSVMYGCFRTKFPNIGSNSIINTYLSAYENGRDLVGKRAITEDEVLNMQETLKRM